MSGHVAWHEVKTIVSRVGDGTKIDNLVMLGHNVVVGRDCLLCSQVGVAGSSVIGDRVVLAGQVGVNDNIQIGDDVIAGGATFLGRGDE